MGGGRSWVFAWDPGELGLGRGAELGTLETGA